MDVCLRQHHVSALVLCTKKNKTGLIPFDNKMKDWISHIFNSIVNIIIADQLKKKAITDLSLIMAANNVVLK